MYRRTRRCFFWAVLAGFFLTGCADKKPVEFVAQRVAVFTDGKGQAKVHLYVYAGNPKKGDVEAFVRKKPCNMFFAYFYPESEPLANIPTHEVEVAKTFNEVRTLLFESEGYAAWRFAARCLAAIPIVTDCQEGSLLGECP